MTFILWFLMMEAACFLLRGLVESKFLNLLRVVDKFPMSAARHYNLACSECQLGRLEQARNWLEKAFALGGARQMKLAALRKAAGVSQPTPQEAKLLDETLRRVATYGSHEPLDKSRDQQSRGSEAVLNLLILSGEDARQNRSVPSSLAGLHRSYTMHQRHQRQAPRGWVGGRRSPAQHYLGAPGQTDRSPTPRDDHRHGGGGANGRGVTMMAEIERLIGI